jgi:hypothetical protein
MLGSPNVVEVFVYMMASGKRGTIYIGVTSDLLSRVRQHKDHLFKNSFTDRYDVTTLVWYEALGDPTHRPSSRRKPGPTARCPRKPPSVPVQPR